MNKAFLVKSGHKLKSYTIIEISIKKPIPAVDE